MSELDTIYIPAAPSDSDSDSEDSDAEELLSDQSSILDENAVRLEDMSNDDNVDSEEEQEEEETKKGLTAYIELFKAEGFRSVWLSSIVSWIGDAMTQVALIGLLALMYDSALIVGLFYASQSIMPMLVSPVAGVFADRFDRRLIMIISDLLRGFVILGYAAVTALFYAGYISGGPSATLLLILMSIQSSLSGFFSPASSALLPQVIDKQQLLSANTIANVSWGVFTSLGMGMGGLIASGIDIYFNFYLDSVTFFLSAFFITQLFPSFRSFTGFAVCSCLPCSTPSPSLSFDVGATASESLPANEATIEDDIETTETGESKGFMDDFMHGCRYLWSIHRDALWITLMKGLENIPLGASDVIVARFAEHIFNLGREDGGIFSLGVTYAITSCSSLAANLLVAQIITPSSKAMRQWIQLGWLLSTVGFFLFAWSPNYIIFLVGQCSLQAGNSILYVFTTTILQKEVASDVQGRVFATGYALRTVLHAVGALSGAFLVDLIGQFVADGLSYRITVIIFAVLNTCIALSYVFIYLPNWQEEDAETTRFAPLNTEESSTALQRDNTE